MDLTPAAGGSRTPRFLSFHARDVLLVAILIFLAAIAGSLSRPVGFLAAFWPANAVLAGAVS